MVPAWVCNAASSCRSTNLASPSTRNIALVVFVDGILGPVFVLGGKALVTHEGDQPAFNAQRESHHGDLQHQHLGGEPQVHMHLLTMDKAYAAC